VKVQATGWASPPATPADLRREIVMDDPQTVSFARHVHEVIALDARGASPETVEARVDQMDADREER